MDLAIQKILGRIFSELEFLEDIVHEQTAKHGLIYFESDEYAQIYYKMLELDKESVKYNRLQLFIDKSQN
jgi:hypothetical protein